MSYENPAMPQGGSPINKFLEEQQRQRAADQRYTLQQQAIARQKEKERQAQINKMQEMQYKVDMLSLQKMDQLGQIVENPTLDNEVTNILRDRIDIASQAQLYLMTDFSDNKKRAEAKEEIANYQNLLNLTQNFAASWDDITKYWNEKKDGIGSTIAVLGTDNYSMDQNQWLVNSMAGKIPGSKISLRYDEKENDLKLIVSGKNGNGENMETRTISARKWMELDDSDDNDFIQEVPQIFQEFAKKLGPNDFNLLTAKGILDPSMIDGDDTSIDIGKVMSADGKTRTGTKQDIRTYYDISKRLPGMNTEAATMIAGVEGMGFNAMKNFYEFNLKMNNGGNGVLPNNYKDFVELVKKDITGKTNDDGTPVTFSAKQEEILSKLLIDQTLSTTGLKKDDEGRYYTSKISVAGFTKPKGTTSEESNQNNIAAQFDNAIKNGTLDTLDYLGNSGIEIERVAGSSTKYRVKGKKTATDSQANYGIFDIPPNELYSEGAIQLRRLLKIPEAYNIKPKDYVTPTTNSPATNDIINYLKMAQIDDAVDNIDELSVRYKGEEITFAELKEKIPGIDFINNDPVFGNKITVKLPIQKGGKTFSQQFNIPLSEADINLIDKALKKTILKSR